MSFIWFTNPHGVIGIAKVETEFEGVKYYISAVSGLDVDIDQQTVIEWGARFPDEAGDVLFKQAEALQLKQAKNLFYKKAMRGGT